MRLSVVELAIFRESGFVEYDFFLFAAINGVKENTLVYGIMNSSLLIL